MRIFEDAWMRTWPDRVPGTTGVIVSIQRDGTTVPLDDVEWRLRYLETEIEPRLE